MTATEDPAPERWKLQASSTIIKEPTRPLRVVQGLSFSLLFWLSAVVSVLPYLRKSNRITTAVKTIMMWSQRAVALAAGFLVLLSPQVSGLNHFERIWERTNRGHNARSAASVQAVAEPLEERATTMRFLTKKTKRKLRPKIMVLSGGILTTDLSIPSQVSTGR